MLLLSVRDRDWPTLCRTKKKFCRFANIRKYSLAYVLRPTSAFDKTPLPYSFDPPCPGATSDLRDFGADPLRDVRVLCL